MNDDREQKNDQSAFELHKRRELMADGRRYIIYYTFGKDSEGMPEKDNEQKEDV